MIRQGKELRAGSERFTYGDSVGFYLFDHDQQGNRLIAAPVEFVAFPEGALLEPSFRLPEERAQQLMNDLWDAGLRPAQGKQSEGVTAAQGKHLQDMRAIAFAKLKVDRP